MFPAALLTFEAGLVHHHFCYAVQPDFLIKLITRWSALYFYLHVACLVDHAQQVFIDHVEGNLSVALPVDKLERKPFIIKPLTVGACGTAALEGIHCCEYLRLRLLIPLRIGADKIVAAKPILAFDERRQKFHGCASAFGSRKLDQVGVQRTALPVTPAEDLMLCDIGALQQADIILDIRSEEHTSELQSRFDLVCRLLLEK